MTAPLVIRLGPPAKEDFVGCGLEHRSGTPRIPADDGPVLRAIDRLAPGEAVRLSLDHDPGPLLDIVAARHPGRYGWEPVFEGPARWVGLVRRRAADEPGGTIHRVSPRLVRRVGRVRAHARLEGELRAIASDLLGDLDGQPLPAEVADWVASATDSAVTAVRDVALTTLVEHLDGLLAGAPADVTRRLDEARKRRDAGLV